jgi:hypothetical protein
MLALPKLSSRRRESDIGPDAAPGAMFADWPFRAWSGRRKACPSN